MSVTNGSGQLQDGTGNMGCGKTNGLSGVAVPDSNGATFGGANGTSCAVAFVSTASSVNTEYLVDGRVDYNISARQKLYFRISRDYGVQASSTSPISPLFNGSSPQPWVIPQLNYTFIITPNIVNNLVLNGNYYSAIFYGSSDFAASQQALPLGFAFYRAEVRAIQAFRPSDRRRLREDAASNSASSMIFPGYADTTHCSSV